MRIRDRSRYQTPPAEKRNLNALNTRICVRLTLTHVHMVLFWAPSECRPSQIFQFTDGLCLLANTESAHIDHTWSVRLSELRAVCQTRPTESGSIPIVRENQIVHFALSSSFHSMLLCTANQPTTHLALDFDPFMFLQCLFVVVFFFSVVCLLQLIQF